MSLTVLAAIWADLEVTPIGTQSRLADELAGSPILRRTVERVAAAHHITGVHVCCPAEQQQRCAELLTGTPAVIHAATIPPAPWSSLVQPARKWALDSWRGGLGGTTAFDEYTHAPLLAGLLRAVPAEAVLVVPPASPAFLPGLADEMIDTRARAGTDIRLVFTQAPPGVAGLLLDADLVHELAEKQVPPGWVFSYKPDHPAKDLVFQPCCHEIPAPLRHAQGRLIADTRRSLERVTRLLADHAEPTADELGTWLLYDEATTVEPLPREVEVELTTRDPYPDARLRPRGPRLQRAGDLDIGVLQALARELGGYDDSLLVLGGFGEPLQHPRFTEILQVVSRHDTSDAGPFGLAVRTVGVDLDDARIEQLLTARVDVLNVILDSWSSECYGPLHAPHAPGTADLNAVLARIDAFIRAREARNQATPVLAPELTKTTLNVDELDAFFDGWIRRQGAAVVTGYSPRAGQLEDLSVINMAPPARLPCRRLRSRCLVLADGSVVACDQDFRGLHALGSLRTHSLADIWQGEAAQASRTAHQEAAYAHHPLCPTCTEWHRP